MRRVEANLGAIGTSKARSIHNSVMELRNICNHPYLSQLHVDEVDGLIPKHYLPNFVRLCGKLEMLDRLLPKLKATDHRVLLFSTMTRLLDVMEDYLIWKQYRYLRLDGHTSGGDRGALIEGFNQSNSPYFIFLLSIRAGGVGVNLQAADTVIIFDTDWNPQVDLQAQARAHRIGQKKDVLVLRLETVQTVEEQVRASAEHKLGVANQSITAGFFDNNTSAEDRREYLESLLRECKKEEAAPVLDDDSLNDIIARSESEIDVFESVDKQRREDEMVAWQNMWGGKGPDKSKQIPPLPSRLLTDDDLKSFIEAMKISEVPAPSLLPNAGVKRKGGNLGGLDTQQYGRGKRAREVRSYEEQWTEEEFERICQVEYPESPMMMEEVAGKTLPVAAQSSSAVIGETQAPALPQQPLQSRVEPQVLQNKDVTPPSKRGRGRPKRVVEASSPIPCSAPRGTAKAETTPVVPGPDSLGGTETGSNVPPNPGPTVFPPIVPASQAAVTPSTSGRGRGRGRKSQIGGEASAPRRRGKRQTPTLQNVPVAASLSVTDKPPIGILGEHDSSSAMAASTGSVSVSTDVAKEVCNEPNTAGPASVLPSASVESDIDAGSQQEAILGTLVASIPAISAPVPVAGAGQPDAGTTPASSSQVAPALHSGVAVAQEISDPSLTRPGRGRWRGRGRGRGRTPQSHEETPQRRRRRQEPPPSVVPGALSGFDSEITESPLKKTRVSTGQDTTGGGNGHEMTNASQHATQNVSDPSAEHTPTDPQEKDTNEKECKDDASDVLASKSNVSEGSPSITTLDPTVRAFLSPSTVSENQSSKEVEESNNKIEPNNKGPCVDVSIASVPVVSEVDNNHEASEDSQLLPLINKNSVEMERSQDLNGDTVNEAETLGSMPLGGESDKYESIDPAKSPCKDEVSVSDDLSKETVDGVSLASIPKLSESETAQARADSLPLPPLSENSVEMTKHPDLSSANVQDALAHQSIPLPGESGKCGLPCGEEGDYITKPYKNPNLDVSLAKIATNAIPKIKDTEDESEEMGFGSKPESTSTGSMPGESLESSVDLDLTGEQDSEDNPKPTVERIDCSVSPSLGSESSDVGVGKLEELTKHDMKEIESEDQTAEVPALQPHLCDNLPLNSTLELDPALGSLVPESGIQSAVEKQQGCVESDIVVLPAVSSVVSVPDAPQAFSHSLLELTIKESRTTTCQEIDLAIPETASLPGPMLLVKESKSAGAETNGEEIIESAECHMVEESCLRDNWAGGVANAISEVFEDKSGNEAEKLIAGEHENNNPDMEDSMLIPAIEKNVPAEVHTPATEVACRTLEGSLVPDNLSDGAANTDSGVLGDTVENESVKLAEELLKENTPVEVSTPGTEVVCQTLEGSLEPDNLSEGTANEDPSRVLGDTVEKESGKPAEEHAKENALVEVSTPATDVACSTLEGSLLDDDSEVLGGTSANESGKLADEHVEENAFVEISTPVNEDANPTRGGSSAPDNLSEAVNSNSEALGNMAEKESGRQAVDEYMEEDAPVENSTPPTDVACPILEVFLPPDNLSHGAAKTTSFTGDTFQNESGKPPGDERAVENAAPVDALILTTEVARSFEGSLEPDVKTGTEVSEDTLQNELVLLPADEPVQEITPAEASIPTAEGSLAPFKLSDGDANADSCIEVAGDAFPDETAKPCGGDEHAMENASSPTTEVACPTSDCLAADEAANTMGEVPGDTFPDESGNLIPAENARVEDSTDVAQPIHDDCIAAGNVSNVTANTISEVLGDVFGNESGNPAFEEHAEEEDDTVPVEVSALAAHPPSADSSLDKENGSAEETEVAACPCQDDTGAED